MKRFMMIALFILSTPAFADSVDTIATVYTLSGKETSPSILLRQGTSRLAYYACAYSPTGAPQSAVELPGYIRSHCVDLMRTGVATYGVRLIYQPTSDRFVWAIAASDAYVGGGRTNYIFNSGSVVVFDGKASDTLNITFGQIDAVDGENVKSKSERVTAFRQFEAKISFPSIGYAPEGLK